jgi:hypothetical protein
MDDRRVSGVPPEPSRGGAGGLPDLPREGRGRGVVSETRALDPSLGVRGMGGYMARAKGAGNRELDGGDGMLTGV